MENTLTRTARRCSLTWYEIINLLLLNMVLLDLGTVSILNNILSLLYRYFIDSRNDNIYHLNVSLFLKEVLGHGITV